MASHPISQVILDGEHLPFALPGGWLSWAVDQPNGSATASCSVTFTGPSVAVTADSSLVIKAGYEGAGLDTIFDTSKLVRSQYTIEPKSDGLTATWASRLDLFRDRTPRNIETWKSRGRSLVDFMRYIAEKVGYDSVITNVPPLRMPRRVIIKPETGYWATLTGILDHFRPEILPDDIGGVLYVWWLDRTVPGTPIGTPWRKLTGGSLPKDVRRRVNLVLLRYLANPVDRDGFGRLDCQPSSASFVDGVGWVKGLTSAGCSITIDPSEDFDLVPRQSRQPVPPPPRGGEGVEGEIVRTDLMAVVTKDGKPVEGSTGIPVHSEVSTYVKHGPVRGRRVKFSSTDYRFIAGTQFRQSAGHTSSTEALIKYPLAGERFSNGLYSETEDVVYYILQNDDLVKFRSVKQAVGLVLMPDNVPLFEANTSDTIDLTSSPYQYVDNAVQPLFLEIEELVPSGGSCKYRRQRYNYLRRCWEGPDDEGDAAGVVPATSDIEPDTIEEYYPDPSLGEVEPAIGWQTAETIDLTWAGVDSLYAPGEDATYARDFAIALAHAMFRRAGGRTADYGASYYKYLSKITRGRIAETTKREGAQPHDGIITGCRHAGGRGKDGGLVLQTSMTSRRLEPGTDA